MWPSLMDAEHAGMDDIKQEVTNKGAAAHGQLEGCGVGIDVGRGLVQCHGHVVAGVHHAVAVHHRVEEATGRR